jgi:hypothetical protein
LLSELQVGFDGKFVYPKSMEKELIAAIVDVSRQIKIYEGVGTTGVFQTVAMSAIGPYRLELENIVGVNLKRRGQ